METISQERYIYVRNRTQGNSQHVAKTDGISYEMSLRQCGLTTLEISCRRLRGDQIDVLIILNGYENNDNIICFLCNEDRRTIGHKVTLANQQCILDISELSFS